MKASTFCLLVLPMLSFAQGIVLRPLEGTAIRDQATQLENGTVAAVVCYRPGAEDRLLVAYLREELGVRLTLLYLTNGEAIPTTRTFGSLRLLGAARKEEAQAFADSMHVKVYFMNFPDPGISASERDVARCWDADSLTPELAGAFRVIRPHALFLCEDQAGSPGAISSSVRSQVIKAVALSKDMRAKIPMTLTAAPRWEVQQVFAESDRPPRGIRIPERLTNARRQALGRAQSAASATFRTLEYLYPPPAGEVPRTYKLIVPTKAVVRHFGDALRITGPTFSSLQRQVRQAARMVIANDPRAIAAVNVALDGLAGNLGLNLHQQSELDRRALIHWKQNLEALQLAYMRVPLSVTISDSILCDRQLFFLRVHAPDSIRNNGVTQILFQKGNEEGWIINESVQKVYDLAKDTVFRIVTPEQLSFDFPTVVHGMDKPSLRQSFFFAIVHQSASRPLRRFLFNGEASLRFGPRHVVILDRPVVAMNAMDPLILTSLNISRDAVDGIVTIEDSLCSSRPLHIQLDGKDTMRRDTVELSWKMTEQDTVPVSIRVSGRIVASFRGVRIPIHPDLRRVAVLSMYPDPLWDTALRRMGFQPSVFVRGDILNGRLDSVEVLIVSAEVDAGGSRTALNAALYRWVQSGGHVLYTSGLPSAKTWVLGTDTIRTVPTQDLSGDAPVRADSLDHIGSPAAISVWDEWHFARAYSTLSVGASGGFVPLVSTQRNEPLVVSKHYGRGTATFLTLNLEQQLQEFHQGVFGLLGLLLETGIRSRL